MANTLTNILPTLLAMGLKALRENAVMPRLVNRSYDSLAAQPGNVINVPTPSSISVRTPTAAVTWDSNQDFSPSTVAVTLDFWREASFHLSDSDFLSIERGYIPMQASEAIKALANAVDVYIIGKHTGIYGFAGSETGGTTPFSTNLNAAASARAVLNNQLAPLQDRRAVLSPLAEANLLKNSDILGVDKLGTNEQIIQGTISRRLGFDWFMDQNIPNFVCGTAACSGYIASTVSGVVGQSTINVINATASGALKVGDLFRFTGDPDGNCYVLTTAVACVCATAATILTFTPALKTTVEIGATLIFVSGTYVANLAFHRDAFAWASRPLADVSGVGNTMQSMVDPVSGCALRIEVARQYKQVTYSYDILGGAALVRPALACKIIG